MFAIGCWKKLMTFLKSRNTLLQTHHVYSTLKRVGNGWFHVLSTWNTCCVFVEGAYWRELGVHVRVLKRSGFLKLAWFNHEALKDLLTMTCFCEMDDKNSTKDKVFH